MMYFVKYKIDSRTYVGVEADTPEEALKKSEELMWEKDLGDVEDVDYEPIYVEDDNGKIVLEVD